MSGTKEIEAGLGARIREERERLKHSVSEFASGVGVSDRTQRNYEAGDRLPDAAYLCAADDLGADIDFILKGERSVWRTITEGVDEECSVLSKVIGNYSGTWHASCY